MSSSAMAFVVLCALGAASVSARTLQQSARFPPYNCNNDIDASPFFLLRTWTQPAPNRTCFTVQTKAPTVNSTCNTMDFYKLELEVAPACKDGIRRFFVNGVERVQPTGEAFGVNSMLVKMPQVGLDISNANGAEICIETLPQCSTMQQLCPGGDPTLCQYSIIKSGPCNCCPVGPFGAAPPPPSPPPPSPFPNPPFQPSAQSPPPPAPIASTFPFPYCKCNRTQGITPFTLGSTPTITAGDKGMIYTFNVISNTPIDMSNPCAMTSLYKAEFLSSDKCQRAVVRTYINGRQASPSWDSTFSVWKVVNIGIAASPMAGPQQVGTIGFELDSAGPCPTLSTLCRSFAGSCVYSLFDDSKTCCPLGWNVAAQS